MSATLTAQRPSAAKPALLYPARKRLAGKLGEYEQALADLSEYQAKAARAERDEQQALDNAQLSESEAANSISRAQNLKAVYSSRTANKEKAIATLATELKSTIGEAASELRGLLGQELSRRERIISERVLAALGAESVERVGRKPALAALMEYSLPIETIRRLQPQHFGGLDGNGQLVAASTDVLGKFERLLREMQKDL